MSAWKLMSLGALALTLGAASAQAAPVDPAAVAAGAKVEQGTVTQVQYRGRRWGFRGWGPGVGLGVGIIGGAIIANEIYRPRRGYYYDTYAYDGPYYYPADYRGDPRRICAQHFRSFEWNSGYYTTYGGEHRLCPYLR